jgi:ribose transport system permease protein
MTTTTDTTLPDRKTTFRVWRSRHGWTAGVWVLLIVLVAWYAALLPKFGSFQITSILKNSLPLVFLAIGQGVVVIAGGIDLGVGSMMILANSVAALLMEGQPFAMTLVIGVGIILGLAAMNAVVGWIISVSGVPDIVVTLATLFIYGGLALLILPGPGGGTSEGMRWIFTGSITGVGTNFWPPLLMLLLVTAGVAWFMRRTRPGLSLYANGSDLNAAYLSGVDTKRSKILSYAISGGLAGLAGLAVLALTNVGDPRFALAGQKTLESVAAIVLGGIALTGGVGSVVGVVAAGIIVFFLDLLLVAVGLDSNTSQIVQGVLIIVVMMVAGLLEVRRRRLE